jgi:hypothetical protein
LEQVPCHRGSMDLNHVLRAIAPQCCTKSKRGLAGAGAAMVRQAPK